MIKKIKIKNFKSIKNIELDCSRINVFIGNPNSGKSNILESFGLLSWSSNSGNINKFVRATETSNLFYNELILDNPISIDIQNEKEKLSFFMEYLNGSFVGEIDIAGAQAQIFRLNHNLQKIDEYRTSYFKTIKFYRFEKHKEFTINNPDFLLPPDGQNLFSVVTAKKELKESMKRLFKNSNARLIFKHQNHTFEVQKQVGDDVIDFPYNLVPDTLQCMAFYWMAIETNKNSTIIFEEPEANTFPYFTKLLAEKIALDKSNQYFIATHNPYLLRAIIEKSEKEDSNIFITYMEDEQETRVKLLNQEQKEEILDIDPFFNLDSYLDVEPLLNSES